MTTLYIANSNSIFTLQQTSTNPTSCRSVLHTFVRHPRLVAEVAHETTWGHPTVGRIVKLLFPGQILWLDNSEDWALNSRLIALFHPT